MSTLHTAAAAVDDLATVWHSLATRGMGETVFGSLNFRELLPLAQLFAATGYAHTASGIMLAWAENDQDWYEYGEPLLVWLNEADRAELVKIIVCDDLWDSLVDDEGNPLPGYAELYVAHREASA